MTIFSGSMNLSRYINIFHGSATLFKNHYEHFTKSLKYVIVRTVVRTFQHTFKILESNIMFKHLDAFKFLRKSAGSNLVELRN